MGWISTPADSKKGRHAPRTRGASGTRVVIRPEQTIRHRSLRGGYRTCPASAPADPRNASIRSLPPLLYHQMTDGCARDPQLSWIGLATCQHWKGRAAPAPRRQELHLSSIPTRSQPMPLSIVGRVRAGFVERDNVRESLCQTVHAASHEGRLRLRGPLALRTSDLCGRLSAGVGSTLSGSVTSSPSLEWRSLSCAGHKLRAAAATRSLGRCADMGLRGSRATHVPAAARPASASSSPADASAPQGLARS